MTAKEIVSGVGTRYGAVYELDADTGLPMPAAASSTPYAGVEIEHIKTATATDPAPRRLTHQGEDRAYAQDSLPATELESFSFTTSAVNIRLDVALEGTEVYDETNFTARLANSDRKGNEPLMGVMFYRQALDTDPESASFGKLRQWNTRIYPSARVTPVTPSFEAETTDSTYEGTVTNVNTTLWGEAITETNFGANEGAHIEAVTAAHPRWNFYRGNGTLTNFLLSAAPNSSAHLLVWVDGSLTTPSSVNTGATPSFTLGAAAGLDLLVAALIQTDNP